MNEDVSTIGDYAETLPAASDLWRDLLYRGLRACPRIFGHTRVFTQIPLTSRMTGSLLVRKPPCTYERFR